MLPASHLAAATAFHFELRDRLSLGWVFECPSEPA